MEDSDQTGNHALMARRDVLILGIAGTVAVLPIGGCVFAFLRIFVGRGLAGTLARAARVGRASSALTFGRGVAVGARLAPARTVGLTRGSILGPRQRMIANFESSSTESRVIVDRSPVFFSRKTRYGFDHNDYNGPCGRSIVDARGNVIRHETDDGILASIDRVDQLRGVIEHLRPDSSKIGETRYSLKNSEVSVTSDSSSIESINNIRSALGLQCPEVKEAYEDWMSHKKMCGNGNMLSCREISSKGARYEMLRDQCVIMD
jgi:hypothetical protein